MRKRANVFLIHAALIHMLLMVCAIGALQALLPIASLASDLGDSDDSDDPDDPDDPARYDGEDRWVPSLAITAGATIQDTLGFSDSFLFEDLSPNPVPLRDPVDGDDLAVSPFVGGALELMTPTLPIATRPRLFLSGEILPTFAADRDVAIEGDPDCIRGPEPDAPCAKDENGLRQTGFGESSANGQGTSTIEQVQTLVFGASLGVAFPLQIGRRQLRIKPSVGWLSYEVAAEGLVVDAACSPTNRCTDVLNLGPGFLREQILTGSASQRFNGIGPGLDIEVDAARFGPIGASLFLGGRAYRVLGNRTISFGASESYNDVIGMDTAVARWEVEVDPWIYRAHVGIRFHWLGSRD